MTDQSDFAWARRFLSILCFLLAKNTRALEVECDKLTKLADYRSISVVLDDDCCTRWSLAPHAAEAFVDYLKAGETFWKSWIQANIDRRVATRSHDDKTGEDYYYSSVDAVVMVKDDNYMDKMDSLGPDTRSTDLIYIYTMDV